MHVNDVVLSESQRRSSTRGGHSFSTCAACSGHFVDAATVISRLHLIHNTRINFTKLFIRLTTQKHARSIIVHM
ncbi:hypothetical protein BaRGS_00032735, partial [Batillaria attramentaria]